MKMKRFALTILLTLLSFHEIQAQDIWVSPMGIGYGYDIGYGFGGGYGYGAASTPDSAYGHAEADIIRAEGNYNAMTAAAMVNLEEANAKYIQNQKQSTEVYLLKQRVLEARHAEARQNARARNARYLEYLENHPLAGLPPRLASSQFDRSTGKITWPSALRRDSFAMQRNEIELLLARQSRMGSDSEVAGQIVSKTRAMHELLRSQIRQIVTQEYLEAYKFLGSLSLEGRFPIG